MSDPRCHPRDFCVYPERFGQVGDVQWRAEGTSSSIRLGAAMLQHDWSKTIRRRLGEERMSLKVFAGRAGMSYDRATKILRGEAIMRLEDIAAAELLLHGVIRPRAASVIEGAPNAQ